MATLLETENITFRDLGITVGSQLTFNPHINEVVFKIYKFRFFAIFDIIIICGDSFVIIFICINDVYLCLQLHS